MTGSDRRIPAALSMDAGLEHRLFDTAQWDRLSRHLDLAADPRDVEVLVTGWGAAPIGEERLAQLPALRAVFHAAGTVRGIVEPAVWRRGVLVTTAATANALPVAEFTLAHILLAGKRTLAIAADYAQALHVDFAEERYADIGNYRRVVGLVGASLIGRRVIELLEPFDLDVLVSDPYLSDAEADALGVESVDLAELFARSDIISLHAPLLPSTAGMVSASLLASVRSGATLINTARGGIVDQEALVDALADGRFSAVLDVTDPEPLPADHPLRRLPNVFLTPHLAGAQGNELRRLGESVVEEVEAYVAGRDALRPLTLEAFGRTA